MLWILASIFAAFFQTIRTGIQKHLTKKLSTDSITWIRYPFGLPFALIYLFILYKIGIEIPTVNNKFLMHCVLGSFSQIIGTILLVSLFSQRNFAVGTTYAKTETIQTALLGILFFGEYITLGGTLAIIIGVIGVILISLIEDHISLKTIISGLTHKSAIIGIASGAGFALAGLFIRQATLSLDSTPTMNAAYTLVIMIIIQTISLGIWIYHKNRKAFAEIYNNFSLSLLVGLTSTLGSIGWFTAFALTQAAYVKAVGQIELIFSLFLTHKIFKEKTNKTEIIGMTLVVLSILLLFFVY